MTYYPYRYFAANLASGRVIWRFSEIRPGDFNARGVWEPSIFTSSVELMKLHDVREIREEEV